MPTDPLTEAKQILEAAGQEVQKAVLSWLRNRHPIHPLEAQWGVPAEVILEAIARSPDLSQRGVRGLIAEAYFDQMVSNGISGWVKDTPPGNHAFDCVLRRDDERVRIQVKSQRRLRGLPMTARQAYRSFSSDKFVVETQKTRAGSDGLGADTRPYRFSDFDILAVCMEASTGDWTQFRYVPARWLIPRPNDSNLMMKFQPVSLEENEDWTSRLEVAIERHLSGVVRTIAP